MLLNAILLALITFLNYPTAILARYLATPEAPIAVAVYGANVLIVALGYQALLRYAAHRRQLIAPEIEMAQIASVQREYNTGFALYAFAFALSFVSVVLALAMHIGLAVFFVVTASGERAANRSANARTA